jgi:hypothetical protein
VADWEPPKILFRPHKNMGFADGLDSKKGLIIVVVIKDGRS